MSITASEARKDLFPLIEQVNDDRTPIEITSRRGDAVLLSRADYDALGKPRTSCDPQPTLSDCSKASSRPSAEIGPNANSPGEAGIHHQRVGRLHALAICRPHNSQTNQPSHR